MAAVNPCGRVAPVTFPDSSTAEQSTVNRQVLGSNPSQGASNPRSEPYSLLNLSLSYVLFSFCLTLA